MKFSARHLAEAAVMAALYAALTLLLWQFSSMQLQIRVSEALTVLPALYASAVPGLFVGCFLGNLLMGNVLDAVLGSITTLLAALLGRLLAKRFPKFRFLVAQLPAVLLNAVTVPFILIYAYGIHSFGNAASTLSVYFLLALSVLLGELISCYALGVPLYFAVKAIKRPAA